MSMYTRLGAALCIGTVLDRSAVPVIRPLTSAKITYCMAHTMREMHRLNKGKATLDRVWGKGQVKEPLTSKQLTEICN